MHYQWRKDGCLCNLFCDVKEKECRPAVYIMSQVAKIKDRKFYKNIIEVSNHITEQTSCPDLRNSTGKRVANSLSGDIFLGEV